MTIRRDTPRVTTFDELFRKYDFDGMQRDISKLFTTPSVEIVNDLVTGGIDKVLSAEQGKTIKTILDGLDTKYLIDSGSNANGSYTKLPDGTLICRGTKTYTNVAFLPIGNVFYADLGFMVFPITFVIAPEVVASIEFGNIGALGSGYVSTTQFANTVMSASSSPRDVTIRYIAIGRWRA